MMESAMAENADQELARLKREDELRHQKELDAQKAKARRLADIEEAERNRNN